MISNKMRALKVIIRIVVLLGLLFLIGFFFPHEQKEQVNLATDNFPDPTGIYEQGTYYAYATSAEGLNIPLARSKSGKNYQIVGDALPALPDWAQGSIWAPHISQVGKRYLLYFPAIDKKSKKRSIGLAWANKAQGPFKAEEKRVATDNSAGGLIDPDTFQDKDGQNYLLYKNDGNAIGKTSSLWLQKLSKNGLEVTGKAERLLTNTEVANPNDNGKAGVVSTIEGPYLTKAPDGTYVLLFSGNSYVTSDYFTGYAISKKLSGPYQYQGALLTTASLKNQIVGPGGAEFVQGKGSKETLLLHGWIKGVNTAESSRQLYELSFLWEEGHVPEVTK
ncbi:glycosyl hydrolase [Lactococcus cremoris subsp. cremoris IBB477]|uniref:Glycosyl hydrolase n=2 Tax=Lactococcus lactis subsp. cremoris TaxID=1359 RepID=A0A1E7G378_LACLC|nr:glycosyl hydrolase [Lactococcus cremoris subsp. cremoris IBB477]